MFKSLTVLAFAAGSALAQGSSSSSSAAASSTGNPLIPSGISSGCNDFLTKLNNNKDLTSCFESIVQATAPYAAGSNATYTKASVTSSLNTLCSAQTETKCPASLIRGQLTDFYMACSNELTSSPVDGVVKVYEVFYALPAFKDVICTKDDAGNYCATVDRGAAKIDLTRRGLESRAPAVTPNIKAYTDANLPFLFINANLPKDALCTPCTRNIVGAWFTFESAIPFAPGYGNEGLLSHQPSLVSAITNTCGANFFSGNVAAAAGLGNSNSIFGNAGFRLDASQGFVAAVLGAVTAIAASTL